MHSCHYVAMVLGAVVALMMFMDVECNPIKPVVPMYCERLCNESADCCSFIYMSWDLSCYLLTSNQSSTDTENTYVENNKTCPHDVKKKRNDGKALQCRRSTISKTRYNVHRKKAQDCTEKDCVATDISHCILHQKENISTVSESNSIIFSIPTTLQPGMKITIYGGYMRGKVDTQISVTKDPKNPTNVWKWFHVIAKWEGRSIVITNGFSNIGYNGPFPISDPLHFTMALEQTENATKCYVNNDLVMTTKPIPNVEDVYIRRFSKVYRVVVHKTGEGCDRVDYGMP